uniref:Uncharacterized protein n=1 Tax=Rhabditophanes sp. KR3021 TaxID=114890 RepID=A0AC35TKY0_9BILA
MKVLYFTLAIIVLIGSSNAAFQGRGGRYVSALNPNYLMNWAPSVGESAEVIEGGDSKFPRISKKWSKLEPSVRFGGGSAYDIY